VLLQARRFIGGVYFVVMNLFVFLCLLLASGVNFVVMSAMRIHFIMPIWFNLFQIESSILTILNFADVLLVHSVDVLLEGAS
jgi:hypothetical protein